MSEAHKIWLILSDGWEASAAPTAAGSDEPASAALIGCESGGGRSPSAASIGDEPASAPAGRAPVSCRHASGGGEERREGSDSSDGVRSDELDELRDALEVELMVREPIHESDSIPAPRPRLRARAHVALERGRARSA